MVPQVVEKFKHMFENFLLFVSGGGYLLAIEQVFENLPQGLAQQEQRP